MPAIELSCQAVERVWGRRPLAAPFAGAAEDAPIGEIWFAGGEAELLVKYLFTSQRLSIQVHPDDDAARQRGYRRGKDEAWLVLDAEPGAVIGLGLTRPVSPDALRAAAVNGSIETLLDWRPVKPGDFFYSSAGTVHAIGAGLSLIEIQQNLDLTYRLYDYGRPRELHLDEAVAVADPKPWTARAQPRDLAKGRRILAEGGAFVVERWSFAGAAALDAPDGELQLIPIQGGGRLDGQALEAGSVWRIDGAAMLDVAGKIDLIAAYPGRDVRPEICIPS